MEPLTPDQLIQAWIPLRVQAWSLILGATLFGTVVGSMVRRVHDQAERFDAKGLAAIVGVIGGAAVTALFSRQSMLFSSYAIGLGLAFFLSSAVLRRQPRTPKLDS